MARVTKTIVWENSYGQKFDITKMSDDYVMNVIAWLQRRKGELQDAAIEHNMDWDLNEQFEMIGILLDELSRRADEGIEISRSEGCESNS